MQQNRAETVRRKPRIILDRRFPAINGLGIGDKGQALLTGIIDAENLEMQDDGNELMVKTIKVLNIELINNKSIRI